MKTPVRFGVIGLGIMGEQYVRFYQEHTQSNVVAVSARRMEQASAVAEKFGVERVSTDWREITEAKDIDAICIALPDDAHFEVAQSAIAHGKHVLIEKPLTTDLAQADALVRLASGKSNKVQVAFNHRWLSSYHHGHTLIEQGAIGKPLYAYARKNDTIFVPTEMIRWADRTTPAWFLSSHDIDLVCWYFAAEPVEARAWGVKKVLVERGIDTYDMISAQVRFENGAIASFESGWIYPNSFPTIVDSFVEVIGERGHLHFDRKRESAELSTNEKFSYPKNFLSSEIFGVPRGAFPSCLDDFLGAIVKDKAPAVGLLDGRRVTAILDAIHKSLATGSSVAVSPMGEL